MRDELRQSLALLPRRSDPWIRIAKPSKGRVKKFVSGRRASTCTLTVEGPAKNELRRTVMFSSHSPEPMIDERGLPDTSPGNNGNDVYLLVRPCRIQESDVLFLPKNIASRNGQSCYRNFLGCQSCRRPASSDAQICRGKLSQALIGDRASTVDSVRYRRQHHQQFGRVLKTQPWVFLQEHLK